jgi:subtilisin family serine protease
MSFSPKLSATQQVKIAILDTGIDLNHPDVQARNENIKDKYNWLNEKAKSIVHDVGGHGTFVTCLLLDFASDAEIYIAKIADKKPASPVVIAKVCHSNYCSANISFLCLPG